VSGPDATHLRPPLKWVLDVLCPGHPNIQESYNYEVETTAAQKLKDYYRTYIFPNAPEGYNPGPGDVTVTVASSHHAIVFAEEPPWSMEMETRTPHEEKVVEGLERGGPSEIDRVQFVLHGGRFDEELSSAALE
jgi:hypothetical protein